MRAGLVSLLIVTGALTTAADPLPPQRLSFSDLVGWKDDDHAAALAAFRVSCLALLSPTAYDDVRGPVASALDQICTHLPTASDKMARNFFEANFDLWWIRDNVEAGGFFTGYYEPVVAGSLKPTPEFSVPLYRRPADLVSLAPPDPGGAFNNAGPVVRRADGKELPYWTRAEIEDGALAGRGEELIWLADPIEAFFIQIQGSATIRLPDGNAIRIGYDGYNGHRYFPVGRDLIDRSIISRENMSMAAIRDYMRLAPDGGKALRRLNPSYVFFRQIPPHPLGQGPLGAQNIPLTAGRSIAIDKRRHVYGSPVWIETHVEPNDSRETLPLNRLVIAQDTGSAIRGAARADVYFGSGLEAGAIAGRLKTPGRFILLLPKGITPTPALGASAKSTR